MSSLYNHFQKIKEIVDWAWTLAVLCCIGYITLGQLWQLYWAMIFLGGLAGSFGLFYQFSCKKLNELESLDTYQLQKAFLAAEQAQELVDEFARRNQRLAYYSDLRQARQTTQRNRDLTFLRLQQVNEQREYSSRASRSIGNFSSRMNSYPRRETRSRITEREYQSIANRGDYELVSGHMRNGRWIAPYYRRRRQRRR